VHRGGVSDAYAYTVGVTHGIAQRVSHGDGDSERLSHTDGVILADADSYQRCDAYAYTLANANDDCLANTYSFGHADGFTDG
jgi:hypothetical protein